MAPPPTPPPFPDLKPPPEEGRGKEGQGWYNRMNMPAQPYESVPWSLIIGFWLVVDIEKRPKDRSHVILYY